MNIDNISKYLDNLLNVEKWREKDRGANGLQLVGKKEVKKVALSVDACEYTIKKAIEKNADLLIVHHGIFYGKINLFDEITCKRTKLALDGELSVYAAHLSLDAADSVGNNDQLLQLLGAEKRGRFYEFIGSYGDMNIDRGKLKQIVEDITGYRLLGSFDYGPQTVKRIAVLTGSGAKSVVELPTIDADTLITGAYDDGIGETAKELGVNVLFAGHIATEQFGVKAIGEILQDKGLTTFFIKQFI